MKRRRREWLRRLRVALRVMRGQRVMCDTPASKGRVAYTLDTGDLHA